ncbi:zinc finger protein 782-like [Planococcus citri]|uniref:zinc finger protein 782-like n=1 Tax=Planococcus citri TaxID=170843 RepID=UPI0031F82236
MIEPTFSYPLEKIYTCTNCGRGYVSMSNLNRHLRFQCGVHRKFKCPLCAKKFVLKQHLKSHLISQSSPNPTPRCKKNYDFEVDWDGYYICPNKCGRKYKIKGSLTKHYTLECGVQPQFRCGICSKSFKQKVTLKAHLVSIHGKNGDETGTGPTTYYACPNKCGRKYKHVGNMKRHARLECGVEPKFQCDVCGKKFRQKVHEQSHMLTHLRHL